MELIEWDEHLEVSDVGMDSQHKKLVVLLNSLNQAVINGQTNEVMDDLLSKLIKFTVKHFEYEEDLMFRLKYDGYEEHKYQHEQLLSTVLDLQSEFRLGSTRMSQEQMRFLKIWLKTHILGIDISLSTFLASQRDEQMLTKKNEELFLASKTRLNDSADFLDTFYKVFTNTNSEVWSLFKSTDMEAHKAKLQMTLDVCASHADSSTGTSIFLEHLGKTHLRLSVPISLYDGWLNSLVSAAQQCDPEFTSETEAAWRDVIGKCISLLMKHYPPA